MRARRPFLDRHALRPFSLALLRAHRGALRHPRVVLAAAALIAGAMLAGLTHGRMALSIRETVDPDTRASRWLAQMEGTFGGGHPVLLFFSRGGPGGRLDEGDLAAIRSFLEREQRRNPELVRVTSPWDARRAARIDGRLRLLPVLEGDRPEGLAALAGTPYGGILTDRDGRDVAVELVLRDTPGRSFFGRFDPRPVGELLARARAEVTDARPGLHVHVSGAASFEWFALRAQDSLSILNAVVLLLLLVAFRILVGTWRSGLLIVLVVAWAGAIVYGGMALSGMPIDLLSTGLFMMLAVAAIEDFVFVGWERLAHGAGWRRAFRILLVPGALTSLTTFVGFASLGTAQLSIVRRFGLWGATGAALEFVATFLLLPALLKVAPSLRPFTDPSRALAVQATTRLVGRHLPRRAAGAALLVLGVGAWGATHLDFADSPGAWFRERHPFNEASAYASATRGWIGQLYVVFPDDASMGEVAAASRELATVPGVAQVLDPATLLASWTGGARTAIFELASEITPSSASALVGEGGRMRAAVFLTDADVATVARVRDEVLRRFPDGDGFPAGELVSYADFSEVVPRTLLQSLGSCLLLVGLLVALLYRAVGLPGGGGWAVLASAFGPAAALSVVWASGLHVNFVTVVFASVLAGLTGDNAVQFACAAHGGTLGAAIDRRGGAAALVTLVMAACALTFLGSTFVPPQRLGLLLAGGLVAALVGDLWVLRALGAPTGPDPGPLPPSAHGPGGRTN